MRVGLIPPIAHLNEFGRGSFHLVLSHLLNDFEYRDHYANQAKNGAFVVLDNSAHEHGVGGDPLRLLNQAIELGALELVCPDVLFDWMGTLDHTFRALELYVDSPIFKSGDIRLMVVPQGNTIYEWGQCMDSLCLAHTTLFKNRPFTLGISKDYEVWPGGLMNLLDRFVLPAWKANAGLFTIHMLGWGRELHQLSAITARYAHLKGFLRSTDSAKPFVYALNGIRLDMTRESPEYPRRSPDYFQATISGEHLDLARWNIEVFRARALWDEEYPVR